jgi:4-hydroxybenzoate polyprenyltransferase
MYINLGGTDKSFNNWMTFLMERAPPLYILLIATGSCLSVLYSTASGLPVEKFLWAAMGEQILLLLTRVMDDVKNFERDKTAHPDKPLPRGLIRLDEVRQFIGIALTSTAVYGVILSLRFGFGVGAAYELQIVYGCLMYVEFGMGDWLKKRPFLYAVTHEMSCFTAVIFLTALAGKGWLYWEGFLFGCLYFTGSFMFSVCRNLDPYLPKLQGTFLIVCGKWQVFAVSSGVTGIQMTASYALDLHGLLWPFQLALIASLLFLCVMPLQSRHSKRHKPVELFSAFCMTLHLWMPFIAKLLISQE